jgi:hypothetical protein
MAHAVLGCVLPRGELRWRAIRWLIFRPCNVRGEWASVLSPSGKYRLEVANYTTGPKTWEYTRGVVRRVSDNLLVADIRRNYSCFWHCFVQHANGKEYLLCGEDYQGYNVVDLGACTNRLVMNKGACYGGGFCWISATPSPDGTLLAVEGCIWACPYETRVYDFSSPDKLPLPCLGGSEDIDDSHPSWEQDPDGQWACLIGEEFYVRKSDGKPLRDLSSEEEDSLKEDEIEERHRITRWRKPAVDYGD